MNKRQLEKSRNYWKEMAIIFIFGTIAYATLMIFVGYDSFDHGYSHGVNDTLNNYTCTPKIDYSQVKCACCGEFCMARGCNYTYGTYQINSSSCLK